MHSFDFSLNSTWLDEMKSCTRILPCKHDLYDFVEVDITSSPFVDTSLELQIGNNYVIYVMDYKSYDFQSFFGEVGGTLGVLLGISMASIFDLWFWIYHQYINRYNV